MSRGIDFYGEICRWRSVSSSPQQDSVQGESYGEICKTYILIVVLCCILHEKGVSVYGKFYKTPCTSLIHFIN